MEDSPDNYKVSLQPHCQTRWAKSLIVHILSHTMHDHLHLIGHQDLVLVVRPYPGPGSLGLVVQQYLSPCRLGLVLHQYMPNSKTISLSLST